MSRTIYLIVTLVFAVFAAVIVWHSTVWGIGVSSDSLNYVNSIQALLRGEGLLSLNTDTPPGYPLIVSLFPTQSETLSQTLRVFHTSIFALCVVLLALALRPKGLTSTIIAGLAVLFVIVHPLSIDTSIMAWSESLFVLLQLAAVIMIAQYFAKQKFEWLVLSAFFTAGALLTRYAAVPLYLVIVALLVFDAAVNRKAVTRKILVFSIISWAPLMVWLAGQITAGNEFTHQLSYHPIDTEKLIGIADSIRQFFSTSVAFPGYIFLAGLVASYYFWFKSGNNTRNYDHVLIGFGPLYLVTYTIFIILSLLFLDENTPTDKRLFFPPFVFLILSAFLLLTDFLNRPKRHKAPYRQYAAGLIIAALFLTNALYSLSRVRYYNSLGVGYMTKVTAAYPVWKLISTIEDKTIYSNTPEFLRLYTTKDSVSLPKASNPGTEKINKGFESEVEKVIESVARNESHIIYFHLFAFREYFGDTDRYLQSPDLSAHYNKFDAYVLGADTQ